MTEFRFSRPGDEPALKDLWRAVFGPEEDFIELFFREAYTPGCAAVACSGGEIVSAAYVIPFGEARYVYAVGTRPDQRGRGLGKAVTLAAADGRSAYLYPADRKLRDWYVREMGARSVCLRPVFDAPESLIPVSPEEYVSRREDLLRGIPHARYPRAVLDLFSLNGSFFADEKGGIWAMEDGRIRESLPCRFSQESYLLGLNGAPPLYWGLTLI